jgi:hypothetical protein
VVGVEDPVQRTGDDRTCQVLGGQAIERSGGAVCGFTVHAEMRSACFLVESRNQGLRFVIILASKPVGRFSTF